MTKDIAKLIAQVDEQKEQIRQLEEALGFHLQAPLALNLTPALSAMFGCLYARPIANRHAILQAHAVAAGCSADSDPKTIDVHMVRLRKKLAPYGIEIETIWGQGYRMPEASKRVVKELLVAEAAHQAALAAMLMEHSHAKPAARRRAL